MIAAMRSRMHQIQYGATNRQLILQCACHLMCLIGTAVFNGIAVPGGRTEPGLWKIFTTYYV
jgi:hypothetical protein